MAILYDVNGNQLGVIEKKWLVWYKERGYHRLGKTETTGADRGWIYSKNGSKTGFVTEQGIVTDKNQTTVGKVEIQNKVGIVYDAKGVKAGEVKRGGENTHIFGGALLLLVLNYDDTKVKVIK